MNRSATISRPLSLFSRATATALLIAAVGCDTPDDVMDTDALDEPVEQFAANDDPEPSSDADAASFDMDDADALQGPVAPASAGRDLTFGFVADPQFSNGVAKADKAQLLVDLQSEISSMTWSDGSTSPMEFLLVGGDLTQGMECPQWRDYKDVFKPGRNPDLNFSVYQVPGNHDHYASSYCPSESEGSGHHTTKPQQRHYIRESQGRHSYIGRHDYVAGPGPGDDVSYNTEDVSFHFEAQGVHIIGLEIADNGDEGNIKNYESINFLDERLAAIGPDEPVIIFQHFGFDHFSVPGWWSDAVRESYLRVIEGHNVLAILSGHLHSDGGNSDRGALRQPRANRDSESNLDAWWDAPPRVDSNNPQIQYFELRDFKGGLYNQRNGGWAFRVTDERFEARLLEVDGYNINVTKSFDVKIPTKGTADVTERFNVMNDVSELLLGDETNKHTPQWDIATEGSNGLLRLRGNAYNDNNTHRPYKVAAKGAWAEDPRVRFGAGELAVRIKPKDDDSYGVMYAMQSDVQYYRVLVNHQHNIVRLVRRDLGGYTEIASAPLNLDLMDQMTTLKIVRTEGNRHKVWLHGHLKIDVVDNSWTPPFSAPIQPSASGSVAMWGAGMSEVLFDRFEVRQD